jgi:hypothetical protein
MLVLRQWGNYTLTYYSGHGYFLSDIGGEVLRKWTDITEHDAIAMFEEFVVTRELTKDREIP